MSERVEELREQLEQCRGVLEDLIYEALREAVERGERERPTAERRLTRARNALERAISLLGAFDEERVED